MCELLAVSTSLFREPGAAGDSALVRYLESHGPATGLAISHIRHATQGSVRLANTQPFVRQLGGRTHVFAHNGDLSGLGTANRADAGRWQPVGDTDSQQAFCALLARVEPLCAQAGSVHSLPARLALLAAILVLAGWGAAPAQEPDVDRFLRRCDHETRVDMKIDSKRLVAPCAATTPGNFSKTR